MSEMTDSFDVAEMAMDFIRRSGGGEAVAEICGRLFQQQNGGSVCLQIDRPELEILASSPLVSFAPDPSGLLVADRRNLLLYTRRNWRYENAVLTRVRAMAANKAQIALEVPDDGIFAQLKECQKNAVRIMCGHQFSILAGGPGTGKTYTIARAVKLLQKQCGSLAIALAAPTGKAAARVRETMLEEAKNIGLEQEIEAVTLHFLLQPEFDMVTFKYNAENKLPLDWLIVDEASMIDLPLMAKLLAALPPDCRLTLVGDVNQLASVEAGRVFGDLCSLRELKPCIGHLTESSRMKEAPDICGLAENVRRGDAEKVLETVKSGNLPHVVYFPVSPDGKALVQVEEELETLWRDFLNAATPQEALCFLNRCRILCAMRKGKFGCEKINAQVLQRTKNSSPVPMMVTRNDRELGVSNGDIGVVMPAEPAQLYLNLDGSIRAIPLALLPDLEIAYAMTIHKSQGSEFDNVILVLPPEGAREPAAMPERTEMLSRELFYTAITRTRGKVLLFADDESIRRCCRDQITRSTGISCFSSVAESADAGENKTAQ